ncbi:molecular chaperone [Skermanella stibiiresistens SB22]|uniref:Molecular chaperone n=1 Tax=Skermanella stibiiresistens SB22 TaxID=1385369 RepID=W9HBX8_9PROT|nr:Hsp70 family protein [Skermanella stibiiresistens]EWY42187.1 molecular chaperone [Skermanella stibiiresistens SB22]
MNHVGIDFGTTNSAVAVADDTGPSRLVPLQAAGRSFDTFRSVLFFERQEDRLGSKLVHWAGPEAIEAYLDGEGEGRFVQSVKSYLAARDFTGTNILGKQFAIEPLVALILKDLKAKAEASAGPLPGTVVVGRPAHFVGDGGEDAEAMALDRLRDAFGRAGLTDIRFELEPVAAAYHYESGLERDELVLIADFGGGTSDFCLLRVGPKARARSAAGASRANDILGVGGVGIAGDSFDSRIVEHCVTPHLGKGTRYRSMDGQMLPMPVWPFEYMRRWHLLSFLNTQQTRRMLADILRTAEEPDRISALITVIEDGLGFHLHRAVEQAKVALSASPVTQFRFALPGTVIETPIRREDFEDWVTPETTAIASCVDDLMARTGIAAAEVDRVFLTGGSSFIPVIRKIFADRFGEGKLRTGGELTSVASGLALAARETARVS